MGDFTELFKWFELLYKGKKSRRCISWWLFRLISFQKYFNFSTINYPAYFVWILQLIHSNSSSFDAIILKKNIMFQNHIMNKRQANTTNWQNILNAFDMYHLSVAVASLKTKYLLTMWYEISNGNLLISIIMVLRDSNWSKLILLIFCSIALCSK